MWRMLKKGLYFIFLVILTLVIGYVLLLWVNQTEGQTTIQQLRIPLLFFRIALCVALIGFWPKLVKYFSSRQGREWPAEYTAYMVRIRWKVALLLVLVELIVMQNIIGRLLA